MPDATGLTMDDAGYLWASDNLNGYIYKIDPEGTGIAEGNCGTIAAPEIALAPNPFTTSLTITAVGYGSPVTVRIYDSAGRTVRTEVADGQISWSGRDDSGALLPAGMYTIVASGDGTISSSRAVLLR